MRARPHGVTWLAWCGWRAPLLSSAKRVLLSLPSCLVLLAKYPHAARLIFTRKTGALSLHSLYIYVSRYTYFTKWYYIIFYVVTYVFQLHLFISKKIVHSATWHLSFFYIRLVRLAVDSTLKKLSLFLVRRKILLIKRLIGERSRDIRILCYLKYSADRYLPNWVGNYMGNCLCSAHSNK